MENMYRQVYSNWCAIAWKKNESIWKKIKFYRIKHKRISKNLTHFSPISSLVCTCKVVEYSQTIKHYNGFGEPLRAMPHHYTHTPYFLEQWAKCLYEERARSGEKEQKKNLSCAHSMDGPCCCFSSFSFSSWLLPLLFVCVCTIRTSSRVFSLLSSSVYFYSFLWTIQLFAVCMSGSSWAAV